MRQVGLLGLDQGFAHSDRSAAVAQLAGELQVEPLSVFNELGVAILVAGAADKGGPFGGKGCAQSGSPSRPEHRAH